MKKQIEKKIEKIKSMVAKIEEYNEYLNDNTYSTRGDSTQLSFNVKLHYTWMDEGDVEKYIETLTLTAERREQIIEEFDTNRLTGIQYHWIEDLQSSFREDFDLEDCPYYGLIDSKDVKFYGSNGGHLCLGAASSFEKEIGDTELGKYPIWQYRSGEGTFMKWPDSTDEIIADLKEHFEVTTQKEVYENLKNDIAGDIGYYHQQAVNNLALFSKLETDITKFKSTAKQQLIERLYEEINTFIHFQFSNDIAIEMAETGDYSKLDSITELTEQFAITSQNAKVPFQAAKIMLNAVVQGVDITGKKIGHFVVNSITVKPNDTYIKIGCHLFSLAQTKQKFAA